VTAYWIIRAFVSFGSQGRQKIQPQGVIDQGWWMADQGWWVIGQGWLMTDQGWLMTDQGWLMTDQP